jgi:serine/threonine protein kinase
MGVVYLARDQQLHSRPVVVKVLLDDAYQSEYVVQKFKQEVEALSRVDHSGIVGIIDSGELTNGRPFIAMQYVEGVTLRSLITPEGMNLERGADIIRQIGRALSAAHKRGNQCLPIARKQHTYANAVLRIDIGKDGQYLSATHHVPYFYFLIGAATHQQFPSGLNWTELASGALLRSRNISRMSRCWFVWDNLNWDN